MKKLKNLMRILNEYRFVKTVNVIYEYQNLNSKKDPEFEDGSVVLIERCFAMDVPKKGDAIIYKGSYLRVGTIWHNKDENCINVDLTDL